PCGRARMRGSRRRRRRSPAQLSQAAARNAPRYVDRARQPAAARDVERAWTGGEGADEGEARRVTRARPEPAGRFRIKAGYDHPPRALEAASPLAGWALD